MAVKKQQLHPKVYKARVDNAKKIISKADPAVKDVLKEYQKQISPKGVAAAEAAAKKAIEKKYPGMFIPETRKKAGVKKVGKK
jgi:hypothetical protein